MVYLGIEEDQLNLEEQYLCLDFCNTVNWRGGEERSDALANYADLVHWSQEVASISPEEARALERAGESRPDEAALVLNRAIELRETIYRMFSNRTREASVSPEDLQQFNAFLSVAVSHAKLVQTAAGGLDWGWNDDSGSLDCVLWPVVRSAADLLASEESKRVGECANAACAALFYDTSRNHSRHWCSLGSCGNRAKARRHYQRQKPGAAR
jgi:predicted RNA-binding Zn ribbon-like protein